MTLSKLVDAEYGAGILPALPAFSSCVTPNNNDEGWSRFILHGLTVTLSQLVDAEYGAGETPARPAWLNEVL